MSLINYLTRIHFADDVLEDALGAEIGAFKVKRPMIVTDPGIVKSGLVERILDVFDADISPVVFDKTPENPTEKACQEAARIYRESDCDCLIGFGGGSSIDLAKAAAILISHDNDLSSYSAIEGGTARIKDKLPIIIAIPTTSGSGSEVSRTAAIVSSKGRKLSLISEYLVPKIAIIDPTLTLNLPPLMTAATGMDALTTCIEAYIATAYNPPADGIALDGLRRVATNIERAVETGSDLFARREMMAAAMNGALACQKGLGGVHAMSHALGGLANYDLHHGTLNAILLPKVLEFNAPAVSHRYDEIKRALSIDKRSNISNAIARLTKRLGLPTKLSQLGVNISALRQAALLAEKDHSNRTNPRRASKSDYFEIMRSAL